MRASMLERTVFVATLSILVTASTALAQSDTSQWRSITQERLLNPDDGDWLSYRRTYDVFGFSPLDEINRTNVQNLRPVWSYSMRDNNRWVATPIVANGLMYVAEGSGRVVAFDVVSGDVEWIHQRSYPDDIATSQAFGRHRGVAVYEDKIYWGTADSYLVALDAQTGSQVWEVRTGDYKTGQGHNHPPLIADGKVILGATGGNAPPGAKSPRSRRSRATCCGGLTLFQLQASLARRVGQKANCHH
jgi:alcohol dehydrogenase (cytochrome c)